MSRRVKGALGIALSAGGLWWALHGVPWHDVIGRLHDASIPLLVLCAIAATSIFPVRAIRWRIILEPVAPNVPFGPLWRSVAIGMMASNVLPFRPGELVRAYALAHERPDVPFSMGLASVAVDRLFDGAAVLLLMAAAMLDPRFPGVTEIGGRSMASVAMGVILLTVVGFVALYVLARFPHRFIEAYGRVAHHISPKLESLGRRILTSFAEGLGVLRSPGRFIAVLVWALIHWMLNAFAFWLAFKAVHIAVPITAALFVQGVVVFFVSLPSTPGFVGVFESGAKAGLLVYGIGAGAAATWALTFHFVSYIPITVIGLWYLSRAGMTYGEIRHVSEAPPAESPG